MQNIITQTAENTFETELRGVSYIVRPMGGRWMVCSQKNSLRAARMGGGVRFFDTLAQVSDSIKALRGVDLMAEMA
jgi:hypothetical protein